MGDMVATATPIKVCTKCQTDKPIEAFGRDRNKPDGLSQRCRVCRSIHEKASYAVQRDRNLRSHYGIAAEEVDGMIWLQDNRCASCGDPLTTGQAGAHVDHDHTTGSVRGVLCLDCNLGVGRFHDDTARLAGAIRYLEMSWR